MTTLKASNLQVSLFAGRRSSDRVYLLLENWFVAHHLRAYAGTSAVLAVTHIDAALAAQGETPQQRLASGIGEHAGRCSRASSLSLAPVPSHTHSDALPASRPPANLVRN